MKCVQYCRSTQTGVCSSRSVICCRANPDFTWIGHQSGTASDNNHDRRRPTEQDTKLIALSTVSSIPLVFITVKRTSAFVNWGGNYRCVSCLLDRPPAIIIADQNRSYWELPTKAETTSVNYLSVVDDSRTGYEREPFDPLHGVFCQQESNDALIYTKTYVLLTSHAVYCQ